VPFLKPLDPNTIIFRYKIGVGEGTEAHAPHLDVASANALRLNGNALFDVVSGIPISVRVPVGNQTVGSFSFNSKLHIQRSGQRFPPYDYDARVMPPRVGRPLSPVPISLILQFNRILNIDTRQQTFTADVTVVQSWNDSRFASDLLEPVTTYPGSMVRGVTLPLASNRFLKCCVPRCRRSRKSGNRTLRLSTIAITPRLLISNWSCKTMELCSSGRVMYQPSSAQ
jgi:hypothetical protein